jgi:hypothetical protein
MTRIVSGSCTDAATRLVSDSRSRIRAALTVCPAIPFAAIAAGSTIDAFA